MSTLLSIGEFARATHLSVKALRHYHDVGLLEPADIEPTSAYRWYATAQVPTALVIRRLRDLEMPLDEVRAVLDAPNVAARDAAIAAHLQRMEQQLAQTQQTVASLRSLLAGTASNIDVEYRTIDPTRSLAIRELVAWDDAELWLGGALGQLHDAFEAAGIERAGPDSALYSGTFFEAHVGELIAFVPTLGEGAPPDGIQIVDIPAADVAVAVHQGSFDELDRTYGALGTFVTERAIGVEGPIREHYLENHGASDEPTTEVCWPVTHAATRSP
jgi:DNA-binding transcriptional MerR regulator